MINQSNYSAVKKAALVFRAVNHKLRQQILAIIEDKEKTVTELYVILRIEQSVCSQQLSILRRAGIVKVRRDGKFVYYRLDYSRLDFIFEKANDLVK